MKKTRKIIIALLIIVIAAASFVWEPAEIRHYAGEYVSVDAKDGAYELSLSGTGHISVTDAATGDQVMEGRIYRTSFTDGHYNLNAGGNTDDTFLDLRNNGGKASVWLSIIGQIEDGGTDFGIVIIETETDHMQFNEKGFEN